MFDLIRPCAHCPFRRDIPGFLYGDRMQQIMNDLLNGQSFHCHETVEDNEDDENGSDGPTVTSESQHCAGASILLEKLDRPNQMMRICERLRMYDRTKLVMTSPVFDSVDEGVEHHRATQGDARSRKKPKAK